MATLYIIDNDSFLRLRSQHLEVLRTDSDSASECLVRRVPLFDIERVVLAGTSAVSLAGIRALLRRNIPVLILSRTGREIGSFLPAHDGDAGVRIKQYQRSLNPAWNLEMSRTVVGAKLANSRRVLQKLRPGSQDPVAIEKAAAEIAAIGQRAARASSLEELLGYEGAAGATYFNAMRYCFPPQMPFNGRSRRPPADPVNALFSWTYTLTLSQVKAAVMAEGLDPCIGCFHSRAAGRPALALDLLEPLRPALCDLLVLRLVNLRILGPDDFYEDEAGGWRLTPEGMKKFFIQYEQRLQRSFKLRGEAVHTDFRRVMQQMAHSYRMALGDPRQFRVFLMP